MPCADSQERRAHSRLSCWIHPPPLSLGENPGVHLVFSTGNKEASDFSVRTIHTLLEITLTPPTFVRGIVAGPWSFLCGADLRVCAVTHSGSP